MFVLCDKSGNIYASAKKPADIRYSWIHNSYKEDGCYHFLHGVSLAECKGGLIATYGFNFGFEASVTEKLSGKYSADDGKTWEGFFTITPENASFANSHGVFGWHHEALWLFAPHFFGQAPPYFTQKGYASLHYPKLFTEAWIRQDNGNWQPVGKVVDDFWPYHPPIKLPNGNYLMTGFDHRWLSSVAISNGDNFAEWKMVSIPTQEEVYSEAGAWVMPDRVIAVLRNETKRNADGFYHAIISISTDNGEHFSQPEESNLPMSTSKPFCGMLSDNRPYLIFNYPKRHEKDRSCMMIGIGSVGRTELSHFFILDEWAPGLAYPYAMERNGCLYVTYSSRSQGAAAEGNLNDAKLAVIPLESFAE